MSLRLERVSGEVVNLLFEFGQPPRHVGAHALEQGHVEADAVEFQFGQHLDERHFQVVVQRFEPRGRFLGLTPINGLRS